MIRNSPGSALRAYISVFRISAISKQWRESNSVERRICSKVLRAGFSLYY